jgi:hypothetical protein
MAGIEAAGADDMLPVFVALAHSEFVALTFAASSAEALYALADASPQRSTTGAAGLYVALSHTDV